MFEQLIQQLQSPDPEQRQQAIMALANTKNPAALQPLAVIYRSDPDPALRDLALKAGRYIRQEAESAGTTGATQRAASDAHEHAQRSKRDKELARRLLDSAVNFHIQGDPGRAIDNLGRALALNPDLAAEPFAQNLIMALTGLSVQAALPLLMHPDQRAQLVLKAGGKRKLQRTQTIRGQVVENVTWSRILIDLGVYWIASAISTVVALFVMVDLMQEMITAMGTQDIFVSTALNELESAIADNIPGLILSSLVNSIGSTFVLVIMLLVIHYTAVLFFSGDGSMEMLFRKLVPFYTIMTAISTLAFIAMLLLGSEYELWGLVIGIMSLISLGSFVYMVELVARVYDFGWISGCVSVILGIFLLGMFWGCLSYFLSLGAA